MNLVSEYEFLPFSIDPRHLRLEINSSIIDRAWEISRTGSTNWSRWNIYLNLISLQTLAKHFEAEKDTNIKLNILEIISVTELVSGCSFAVDDLQLVIIPIEDIEFKWLEIAQEWIDIPNWIADYYIPVHVDCETGWIQVLGFISHLALKRQAIYDSNDRLYGIEAGLLTQDLNVLWLMRDLKLETATRSPIPPLHPLSIEQAHHLIERLSKPELICPRLEIPFQQWGALLSHGGWRQQLSDRRQGKPQPFSLPEWLKAGLPELIQQFGWSQLALPLYPAGSKGNGSEENLLILSRQLTIAGQPYDLRFLPKPGAANVWRIELQSAVPGQLIPGGFELKLLTEDLQPFEHNRAIASASTELLFIEVALEPGEGLVWETHPLPDNHNPEVLYF